MFVYILSNHGEDGAENVVASTDPAKVRPRIREMTHHTIDAAVLESRFDELVAAGEPIATAGESLGPGWGGPMLHIVELL